MCSLKGYCFSPMLVIKKVFLIWAILVMYRVLLLPSSLDVALFSKRSHFFIIIKKTINKSPSQIMLHIGLNWGTNYI